MKLSCLFLTASRPSSLRSRKRITSQNSGEGTVTGKAAATALEAAGEGVGAAVAEVEGEGVHVYQGWLISGPSHKHVSIRVC